MLQTKSNKFIGWKGEKLNEFSIDFFWPVKIPRVSTACLTRVVLPLAKLHPVISTNQGRKNQKNSLF